MVQILSSFFGGVVLLSLLAAGFLLMFAPRLGRRLLKNTAIALILFVLGSMLLSSALSSIRW